MNDQGILPVISSIISSSSATDTNCIDFVQLFPPELSNKLFKYVTEKDLFSCLKCCLGWQRVINNNPQWYCASLQIYFEQFRIFYFVRKLRCIQRGWATSSSDNNVAQKWNAIKSHVNK